MRVVFTFVPLASSAFGQAMIWLLRTIPYKLGLRRDEQEARDRTASEHRVPGGPFKPLFQGLLDREWS